VLAFQVTLPPPLYPNEAGRLAFFDALIERLEVEPDVAAAGTVQTLPMRGDYGLSFEIRGRAPSRPGQAPGANYRVVSPHYFDALGIPLKRGRAFTAADTGAGQKVAIVDEAFAKRHFADGDPIGQAIVIGNGSNQAYEIVGVVGDVHHRGLEAEAGSSMYVPLAQDVFSSVWVVARSKGDPLALSSRVREIVRKLDPTMPVYSITPMTTVVSESEAGRQFSMFLLVTFAGVALFLAAVGLYGVMGYTVVQRTREIGLRIAIGADPRRVLWMILTGGMKLAITGAAIGLVAALGLGRVVESMLFKVAPWDPVSLAVTAALLVAVALVACYIPARRAMRVDPIVAMRAE
jgi:putative ABC transport system permease protein